MARLVPIDDPADERIAAYRDVRERDLVGREGLFIAEGEVVLNVLVRRARTASSMWVDSAPRLSRSCRDSSSATPSRRKRLMSPND